jgi:hypothetical protein
MLSLFDAAQTNLYVGSAGSNGLHAWNGSNFRAEMLTAAASHFVIPADLVNSEPTHIRSGRPTQVHLTP